MWGLNLTWFECRDLNWFDFCVWVGNYLVLVPRSILTLFFVWCSTSNRDGVLTDRFVGYVALLLGKHSVGVDWLAQWLIRHNRKKEVQASNRSQRWLRACLNPPPKSTGTNRMDYYLPDELVLIGCRHRTDFMQPDKNSFLGRGRVCVGPLFLLQEDRTSRPTGHR